MTFWHARTLARRILTRVNAVKLCIMSTMEIPDDARFLKISELAGLARVSKMTVYRMVTSGELEAVRVGRSYRIPAAAARRMLAMSPGEPFETAHAVQEA